MLSCAGSYVSGAAGSNACPAGSVRIETEAACRTAAAAAGKTPDIPFVETNSYNPRGCYYITSNNYVYLNTHAVGAGEASSRFRLLCAAVVTGPTGAPPSRRCARACTKMVRAETRMCVCHTGTCAIMRAVRRCCSSTHTHTHTHTHIHTHALTNTRLGDLAERVLARYSRGTHGVLTQRSTLTG